MRKNIAIVILAGLLVLLAGCPAFTVCSAAVASTAESTLAEGEVRVTWTPSDITNGADFEGKSFSETITLRPPADTDSVTLGIPDDDVEYSASLEELSDHCSVTFRYEDEEGLTAPLQKVTARVEFVDEDGDVIKTVTCPFWWSEEDSLSESVSAEGAVIADEEEYLGLDEGEEDLTDWIFLAIPVAAGLFSLASHFTGKGKKDDDEDDDEKAAEDRDLDEWSPELTEDDRKAEAAVQEIKDKMNEAREKLTGVLTGTRTEATPDVQPDAKPQTRSDAKPQTRPETKPQTRSDAKPQTRPETKPQTRSASERSVPPAPMDYTPDYTDNPFEPGHGRKRHRDNPFEK